MDRPSPLLEEPDGGARRGRILEPEDLNGRYGRCRHAPLRSPEASSAWRSVGRDDPDPLVLPAPMSAAQQGGDGADGARDDAGSEREVERIHERREVDPLTA